MCQNQRLLQDGKRISQSVDILNSKDSEDEVWRTFLEPALVGWLPENVVNICYHGFTEILNNAIDHSGGWHAMCSAEYDETNRILTLGIIDNGQGAFEKVKSHFKLPNLEEVAFRLSVGGLEMTTDQRTHSGQGIFFTSRAFDEFELIANRWVFWRSGEFVDFRDLKAGTHWGTTVIMRVNIDTPRTIKEIFDMYSIPTAEDEYPFSKTHLHLTLAKLAGLGFISRSEAKRVLSNLGDFKFVVVDFRGVDWIGQAFSDEMFRVFRNARPDVELIPINAVGPVQKMINRAIQTPRLPDGDDPPPG